MCIRDRNSGGIEGGLSHPWFSILMVIGFFLTWGVYPKAEGTKKAVFTAMKTAGVLDVYKRQDNGWPNRRHMPCTPYRFPHSIEKKRDWRYRDVYKRQRVNSIAPLPTRLSIASTSITGPVSYTHLVEVASVGRGGVINPDSYFLCHAEDVE